MCKKITLIILVVVLLLVTQGLFSQENDQQRPAATEADRWAQQTERQRLIGTDAPERDAARVREQVQKRQEQRVQQDEQTMQKPSEPREGARRRGPFMEQGQIGPFQQRFGRLLDALTQAYRQNDMEKMGQLIRQMQQLRQQWLQQGPVFSSPGTDLWALYDRPIVVVIQPRGFRNGWRWWGQGPQDGIDVPQRGFRSGRADRPDQPVPPDDGFGPMQQRPPRNRGQDRRDLPPEQPNPLEPDRLQQRPEAPQPELD